MLSLIMEKYFCKMCSYRFVKKGAVEPKMCPACGSTDIKRDYKAEDLLKEVIDENPL